MAVNREHPFGIALTVVMLFGSIGCADVVNSPQKVELKATDSAADIIEKASSVRPSARQVGHHQDEFIAFIHFGPNTFSGVEWGNGMENPKIFNPPVVDTDQWCKLIKAANMTKVIITVKHHDGYCTWQTRYNKTFSVHQSPWKDGKGDVLGKLIESAKKYGLKVGVYLSPADLYQIESKDGLYGNLSEYRDSVIPTAVDTFQSNPLKQRKVKTGLPTFKVKADDYNRYFMNQLYELLTEYGPIHEVWFDGAHPKRKGGQKYIREEWFAMIRKLAPDAVIFGGPDVRWCGNEHGGTRESEWNVLTIDNLKVSGYDRAPDEIATDRMITAKGYDVYGEKFKSNYLYYIIPEVDTSIRHGWFWRNDAEQYVKSPDEIFDIYERSIGGNSVFLLNIPPNKFGKFSERDEKCLIEVGKRIRATYGNDLSKGATASVGRLFDNNIDTYWQADGNTASFTVTLPTEQKNNRVCLQEAIGKVGQRVKEHALDAWVDGKWKQVAKGTTIGYKKILRFENVLTDRFRVRILDARKAAAISSFSAHYYQSPPLPVDVNRADDGSVSLSVVKPKGSIAAEMDIHYTIDGTEPTKSSNLYTTSLNLPKGAHLKARTYSNGTYGPIMSIYLGIAKDKWSVSADSSHARQWDEKKAVDGDPKTFWHTSWADLSPGHPHTFTVDMGQIEDIRGFSYLPRQDRPIPDGMIETGYIEVSLDGKNWRKIKDFTFGNLVNSPDQRIVFFDAKHSVRYFRLISTSGAAGKPYAAIAELDILSK